MGITFCVGFVTGISPLFGQTLICFFIWLLFKKVFKVRFNLIIACLLTFISNPITTPFLFYIFYLTGQMMIGKTSIPFSQFIENIHTLFTDEFSVENIKDSFHTLIIGVGKPILIGNIPWSVLSGFIGYYIGTQISIRFKRKRIYIKKQIQKIRFIKLKI